MIESVTQRAEGGFIAVIDGVTSFVPDDSGNRDYQAVQAWIAEGNVPEQETIAETIRKVSKSTIRQRLDDAGLLDAAMAALMANRVAFARWYDRSYPSVNYNDAETISLLTAIGANPDAILAEE